MKGLLLLALISMSASAFSAESQASLLNQACKIQLKANQALGLVETPMSCEVTTKLDVYELFDVASDVSHTSVLLLEAQVNAESTEEALAFEKLGDEAFGMVVKLRSSAF